MMMWVCTPLAMFFDISVNIAAFLIVVAIVGGKVESRLSSGITTSAIENNKSVLWDGVESVYSLTDFLFSKEESAIEGTSPYPKLLDSPRFLVGKILTKLFICYLLHFTREIWTPKYRIFGYMYFIYVVSTMIVYVQFTYELIIKYHSIGKTTQDFFYEVWLTKEEMVEKASLNSEQNTGELTLESTELIFFLVVKLISCLIILYVLEVYRRIWSQNYLVIGLLFVICLLVMFSKCLYQLSNTLEHYILSRNAIDALDQ